MGDDVVVAVEAGVVASLRAKFEAVLPHLDERQHRLELRPQRRHHARLNSHYHIIAHEIPYEAVIYRRALRCRRDSQINGAAPSAATAVPRTISGWETLQWGIAMSSTPCAPPRANMTA